MTKGDKRRRRRRYKVRYDRIIILVLMMTAIALVSSSCVMALTKKNTEPEQSSEASKSDDTPQPSDTANIEAPTEEATQPPTEPPVQDNFSGIELSHDDVYKGDLVLVNSEHEYKFIEGDTELAALYEIHNDYYGVSDYVTTVDKNVAEKINALMEAFVKGTNRTTSDIWVIDGYRSSEEQQDRFNNGKTSFEAGYSDYHAGRSFDMAVFPSDGGNSHFFDGLDEYSWFTDHAAEYGFVVRYPDGKSDITGEQYKPQTYRYVGVPHAGYMASHGLCLEEYIEQIKSYTKEEPLVISAEGKNYTVYYVEAEDGNTSVPVPRDSEYSISGDNCEGFIVTVVG